jgi:zinc/manganese transport system ATP-binding protein
VITAALSVRELTVHRGRTTVLDAVTVDLPAGAVTALVGPNGAGKSTLLDVLAGVLTPTSGSLECAGRPSVAYVPQHSTTPAELPLTIADTLAMGRWRDRGLWRRLGRADHDLIAACAAQLDLASLLARPLSAVSGGQRQRALVAQGLVARADVLLVDEPTAGVDAASQAIVLEALAGEAARGAVVVHATHEREAIAAADRVVALACGRVEAAGEPVDTSRPRRVSARERPRPLTRATSMENDPVRT